MSKYGTWALFLVKLLFSLLTLVLLTIIIHEGAHLVTAVIMKVPIQSFTWLDPRYFAPVFVSSITQRTLQIMVVSYSGGTRLHMLYNIPRVLHLNWMKWALTF